jgi:hypothetical protein
MLTQLVAFWNALTASQQSMVIGAVVVPPLIYVGRLLRPAWFADPGNVARFTRMAASIILSLLAALVKGSPLGWVGIVVSWLNIYAGAEAAHTVITRTHAALHSYCARRDARALTGACRPVAVWVVELALLGLVLLLCLGFALVVHFYSAPVPG